MDNFITGTDDAAAAGWAGTLHAFLAEKYRRSGSQRTAVGYGRTLAHFFGVVGKPPDKITGPDVFAWAHAPGLSGREPSATTIGARIATVSSYYGFLLRMEILDGRNPCAALERPKAERSLPRGLSAEQIRGLLSVLPATATGARTRAAIVTLVLTGRRRSEVLELRAGNIEVDGEGAFYCYRGKGGKAGRRELPTPALEAIEAMLAAEGRPPLAELSADERLFVTSQHSVYLAFGRALRRAGLPRSGLHVLRHSSAQLRRMVGASIEEVSRFLDHSSLAVTTTYLRALEGEGDEHWPRVAALIQ
jgi:integrase